MIVTSIYNFWHLHPSKWYFYEINNKMYIVHFLILWTMVTSAEILSTFVAVQRKWWRIYINEFFFKWYENPRTKIIQRKICTIHYTTSFEFKLLWHNLFIFFLYGINYQSGYQSQLVKTALWDEWIMHS